VSSPADRGRSQQVGLDPERLAQRLNQDLPCPSVYWVAFSGGLDSTALLHALSEQRERLPAPLRAVHVDHQLHPRSADWAEHCVRVCRALDIPLTRCAVDARPTPGESPEAAARNARYAVLASVIDGRGMLMTAHHRDDQAETLLLQLMRACGIAGLAAMPVIRPFGDGWHVRPLLELPRAALRQWAQERSLDWVEDPSNALIDADRNYLRHRVLPSLVERWPAAVANTARVAGHAAEALGALREQAAEDLARVCIDPYRLDIDRLRALSAYRRRAVVVQWLQDRGLALPRSDTLGELLEQLLHAGDGSDPRFDLGDRQLRRYRDTAWLIDPPVGRPPSDPIAWPAGVDGLQLPYGSVRRVRCSGGISPDRWANGRIDIRFRQPGYRCQPVQRTGRRDFKSLAQDHGIPPWQRDWLPLLFIDDQPAAVAGCCICEPFGGDRDGWWIEWSVPAEKES
jgi:tRNA(Ile)-lysidine synthase